MKLTQEENNKQTKTKQDHCKIHINRGTPTCSSLAINGRSRAFLKTSWILCISLFKDASNSSVSLTVLPPPLGLHTSPLAQLLLRERGSGANWQLKESSGSWTTRLPLLRTDPEPASPGDPCNITPARELSAIHWERKRDCPCWSPAGDDIMMMLTLLKP